MKGERPALDLTAISAQSNLLKLLLRNFVNTLINIDLSNNKLAHIEYTDKGLRSPEIARVATALAYEAHERMWNYERG